MSTSRETTCGGRGPRSSGCKGQASLAADWEREGNRLAGQGRPAYRPRVGVSHLAQAVVGHSPVRLRTGSRREDGVAAEGIAKPFLGHEIDGPPEDIPQLVDHVHPVVQAPFRPVGELDEDVHVTLRPKVVAEHGAEERQLPHPPSAAELCNQLLRHIDLWHGHRVHPFTRLHSIIATGFRAVKTRPRSLRMPHPQQQVLEHGLRRAVGLEGELEAVGALLDQGRGDGAVDPEVVLAARECLAIERDGQVGGVGQAPGADLGDDVGALCDGLADTQLDRRGLARLELDVSPSRIQRLMAAGSRAPVV